MGAGATTDRRSYPLFCACTVRLGEGNPRSGVNFTSRALAERWYRLERELYPGAEVIFAASRDGRRSLVEDYGVPSERVEIAGEGIDLAAPDDLDRPYDGRAMLFVGYELERKGGPILLEAFRRIRAEVPDAELAAASSRHRPAVLREGGCLRATRANSGHSGVIRNP